MACVLLRRKLRRAYIKIGEAPSFTPASSSIRCPYQRAASRRAPGFNGKARSMRNYLRKRFRKTLWRFTRRKKQRSFFTRAGFVSGMLGASA
jgi:hypothetical protein